ncbi:MULTISPECIES: hypothetical protein [Nostoc]|uniref:Uncharacterized protein n=1 Tax=Nostoc paludosum FACHB-159 TaxID=2692908 RepID=A0ABR8K2D2_9NOSO|nr:MULTISPECIES: hypothetical protein [Nostoc]MBD2676885.1 hypothetical protein [Nostoc sp. FACHB-857]MBD2733083.1 hypothetical protein [Nostoc paludosum FACHB-159]
MAKDAGSFNFSKVIAQKIDVEMQRLETYGKRSPSLLTEVELLNFLEYLQSQPEDPLDI